MLSQGTSIPYTVRLVSAFAGCYDAAMASLHRLTVPDPQRERAYLAYRDGAKRSLRKTAEVTGIPEGTLMRWSREDGWQQRLRDDDRTIAAMRRDAELALLGKHDALIEAAYDDAMNSPDPRVRADLKKYLLGVLGRSPQVAAALAAKGQEVQLGKPKQERRQPLTYEEARAIAARPLTDAPVAEDG